MIMTGRHLPVLRHHRLFAIEAAAAGGQIPPIAHARRENAETPRGIGAGRKFNDVPAESRRADEPRRSGLRAILRLVPLREGRQFEPAAIAKLEHRFDAAIDEGTAHQASHGLRIDRKRYFACFARSIPAMTIARASSASPHLVILTHLLGSRSL